MSFLDYEKLTVVDEQSFQQAKPYPWINPKGLLTDAGYQRLLETLPTLEQMTPMLGVQRSHGQQPHDRYALEYNENLDVDPAWHAFAAELTDGPYRDFIQRLYGRGRFKLNMHWHYAPRGASVSPHCDAARKLGSHIFYFSDPENWSRDWGGDTLILDDNRRFSRNSAPRFEDFDHAYAGESLGNYSLLFQRQENSWHGVREITCPEGQFRKVFIVVINDRFRALLKRAVTRLKGEAIRDY
ncbi:MAG: hypothetical protein CVV13_01795 [Gammaproteobacteria bacterium HGW-Gammaproteobacteria-3]|nr:MAG: hypothetical protein CVV13_01795 [Gammaproteobacteria bacterium HGW-Gammaproteobacteria-3]